MNFIPHKSQQPPLRIEMPPLPFAWQCPEVFATASAIELLVVDGHGIEHMVAKYKTRTFSPNRMYKHIGKDGKIVSTMKKATRGTCRPFNADFAQGFIGPEKHSRQKTHILLEVSCKT
jgi:hypothetical protein